MATTVVIHYSCMSMRASILSGRGMLGFSAMPSVPCLREQLAATGGCSEAGFGDSQAAISAPAALHQGCWAHRQTLFVTLTNRENGGNPGMIFCNIIIIITIS